MTIIAVKNGVMAADSACISAGIRGTTPFPKIVRGHDGSLYALSGRMSDGWRLRQWVLSGADPESPPDFDGTGEDAPSILVIRPDKTVWFGSGSIYFTPDNDGTTIGAGGATHFCEGAMAAGLSAGDAVALTIERCEKVGGPVQVESVLP